MAVVISQDLVVGTAQAAQPLTHARIGYAKITGTITGSTEATGYPDDSANNSLTATYWKPSAVPATWEIDAGASVTVNYCGIAGHEFGTNGNTVTVQHWDGAAWQDIDDTSPADDSPILFIFSDKSSTKYRISITGGSAPRVGVIRFGELLEMQRGIYGGHSPLTLSRKTVVRNNVSENGQFLGRSILRAGSGTSFAWSNLTPAWYRANFDPFVESARTDAFFIAWNPNDYPNEVGYVWTSEDISPTNSGVGRGLMDVTMNVMGLAVE